MKKVMNQSTMTRLLNFGSIGLVILATIFVFLSTQASKKVSESNEDRYQLLINANQFTNASKNLTNNVRLYSITGEQTYYDAYYKEINVTHDRENGIADMRAIGISSAEDSMIEKMLSLSNGLVPLEEQAFEDAKNGKMAQAQDAVFGNDYVVVANQITQLQDEFLTSLDQRVTEEIKKLETAERVMQVIVFVSMATIVVLQSVSLTVINQKLLKPLVVIKGEMEELAKGNLSSSLALEPDTSEIGMLVYAIGETKKNMNNYISDIDHKLSAMARGDMTVQVDMDYIGDFSSIKTSIEQISGSLRETLSQIVEASEQVLEGANQVSAGAQSLAQGATEQASTLEDLSGSFRSVSEEVAHNAKSTEEVEVMVLQASDAMQHSNEKMTELMSAMDEINNHASQINKIIKSIEDIAFQTNILSLNAAVEAARAGEAGKGFAVVADEVRNLAAKSAEEAANTAQMIEGTVKAVQKGMGLTKETADDIQKIVESTYQINTLVKDLNEGTQRQTNAVNVIEQGLDQVTSVVQTNSATSEESAATSEELSSQANMMRDMIGKFKV